MEKIYQSRVWNIYWHDAPKCIHFVFKEYTKMLEQEEYLQELKNYISLIKKYQPKSIYADTRFFYYTIIPEIQDFINKNVLSLYVETGLEKHAVLVSEDFFALVSVEQTMDEDTAAGYENRYFDNEKDASDWLSLSI